MIVPLRKLLLVQPVDPFAAEEDGGIVAVSHDVPQSLRGTVLAIGPEVEGFEVGDTVLYSQYAPTQAREKITDETVVIPQEDVLAKIIGG